MQLHCPSVFQHGPSPQLKSFPLPCRGTKEKSHSVKKFYEIQPHLCFRSLFHSSPPPMSFQLNRFGKDWTWGLSFKKNIDFYLWFNIINHKTPQANGEFRKVCCSWVFHPLQEAFVVTIVYPRQVIALWIVISCQKGNSLIKITLISRALESWNKSGKSRMNIIRNDLTEHRVKWIFIVWGIVYFDFHDFNTNWVFQVRDFTSPPQVSRISYGWHPLMMDGGMEKKWKIFLWNFHGTSWNTVCM